MSLAALGLVAVLNGLAQPLTPPPDAPVTADAATARIFVEAKQHFDAGNDDYAKGRYMDAIRHFQAGYSLVPRPNFLVNLGQAFRKLGDLGRAKEAYVAYVRALPENSALRDQALQVLAEIEVQIQEEGPTSASPPRSGSIFEPSPATIATSPGVNDPILVAPAEDHPEARRHTVHWSAIAAGTLGLGLVATGTLFDLRARTAAHDLTQLAHGQQRYDADKDRIGRRDERLGYGLLAAGGAALATSVALFFWLDRHGESAASSGVALSGGVGPHGGDVRLRLRF